VRIAFQALSPPGFSRRPRPESEAKLLGGRQIEDSPSEKGRRLSRGALSNLQSLSLDGTQVSDEQVEDLKGSLPGLDVEK